jgi:hypothetical protein
MGDVIRGHTSLARAGKAPAMALEGNVIQVLERALSTVDDQGTRGPRLLDDARRLWARVQSLLALNLLPEGADRDALELACYALQLPQKQSSGGKSNGKNASPRHNPRDRAEHAADMLAATLSGRAPSPLMERTARLLHELPQRAPMLEEARLLSDALNLDDFGVTAMLLQAAQLSRTGGGVTQVLDGLEKREQYGYWDARLKDGFHFEPVRKIARERLEHTRRAAALLRSELGEDRRE